MKTKKESEDNTHEKFFWIIGISLIVFMILLLGSIIGLKITRDKIGNVSGFQFESKSNYEVLEDGTMKNINKGVLQAKIDVDNIRFSNFNITQRNKESGDDGEIYDTDISFEIENMNDETEKEGIFLVTLYDSNNEKLLDFTVQLKDILPKSPIYFRQNLSKSCVDTADINVERIK